MIQNAMLPSSQRTARPATEVPLPTSLLTRHGWSRSDQPEISYYAVKPEDNLHLSEVGRPLVLACLLYFPDLGRPRGPYRIAPKATRDHPHPLRETWQGGCPIVVSKEIQVRKVSTRLAHTETQGQRYKRGTQSSLLVAALSGGLLQTACFKGERIGRAWP
jgi:hypothetical protein